MFSKHAGYAQHLTVTTATLNEAVDDVQGLDTVAEAGARVGSLSSLLSPASTQWVI